ncbi:acetate kinase [Mesoplasma photuris]|uniref:acetate kinase n=1 Tax=Mesoplasma photuris TaxID=217731 RepID=UPI0004E26525|nr:acetate kinase [Mesoplasma photuris]
MILVINAGSSSIKFKLFSVSDIKNPLPILEGLSERIGVDGFMKIKFNNEKFEYSNALPNHEVAIALVLEKFQELGAIKNKDEIHAIGFRVVHGGKLAKSVVINDEVYQIIKSNIELAPLHNPAAITVIDAVKKIMSSTKMVACFDTAFHQTMNKEEFLYPVPNNWYEDFGVRKYGFHGISYNYIVENYSKLSGKSKNDLNLIVCHLGNGASISAIKNGKTIDTTMGFTPLAGLMMGTRSGDIDPSIIQFICKKTGKTVDEVTNILNKESGLLGMSGLSADMRDVLDANEKNDEKAKLALTKYNQIVADWIVKFANKLEGKVDAIIFTAGIGENSVRTRKFVMNNLHILGTEIDEEANHNFSYEDHLLVSSKTSAIPVYAMRTDEEKMICLDTLNLTK